MTLAENDDELKRFAYVLGAERVVTPTGEPHLDALLTDSTRCGLTLTRDYYAEYAEIRFAMLRQLRLHNTSVPVEQLIAATQKVLDRVLFIAFCEDRGLLPSESIANAFQHADPYNPRPIWETFKGLFRAVDRGNPALRVHAFNGGLFAPDPLLDERLIVPDAVCAGFKRLAAYEYGPTRGTETGMVDVEILGHIFEQSITDLEELHRQSATGAVPATSAPRRKREGAFYTPRFVTKYLVRESLAPVLHERFDALRLRHLEDTTATAKRVLGDPELYDPTALNSSQRTALTRFWEDWVEDLSAVRLIDPACGSGAFLTEAFDQLYAEYRDCRARLRELRRGQGTLLDPDRTILTNNLFGVDLNGEAVEVARLSLWIKTAQVGKALTALDHNVLVGNSIVADRAVHLRALDWRESFPHVFSAGGFDIVVTNPPYIRQERLSELKPYLQEFYRTYDSAADLYVYFHELALNLLKPGGRLGFVVTNKWMKAGYGERLRGLLGTESWIESVVDLGHNKEVFPDADVFPCILTARKPDGGVPPPMARVCALPREQTRVDDLSAQIVAEGFEVSRTRFGVDPWNLEPPGVAKLMEKIRAGGVLLREFVGASPLFGIKTGFNDAFLLDTATKDKLIATDPMCEPLLKPYLRGQDIDRWRAVWRGLWMLALKSSANYEWPWSKAATETEAESLFRRTYPSVHAHFGQFRTALVKRLDQGKYWWELRSCAYWTAFERPKITYQEIQFHPCYALDTTGILTTNKAFLLPTESRYLLGVLNSPVMWWHNWRHLPHMKDEALTPAGFRMEELPIPEPTNNQRIAVETAVTRLIEVTDEQQAGRVSVLDWLRSEFAVEKPTQKLQVLSTLSVDEFVTEAKKAGKKGLSVADLRRLKDEYTKSVLPLHKLARDAVRLERQVSDVVNAAFGLTPDDVKLMWDTAPPRMPIGRPS